MDVRKFFYLLLIFVAPATAAEIRVASFHVSNLTADSDLQGIADRLQAYDFIAIQDLRDLAAVDELLAILFRRSSFYKILPSQPSGDDGARYAFAWRDESVQIISPGTFLGTSEKRRPVYALFRAGNFDFAAVNFQSPASADTGETDVLNDALAQLDTALETERDILLFASFAHPSPELALLAPLFPRDNPVSIQGDIRHANLYISTPHTREYTEKKGIDLFDENAFANELDSASRVSLQRPLWADFSTDLPDDDGEGIEAPSPVIEHTWSHIKAARPAQ